VDFSKGWQRDDPTKALRNWASCSTSTWPSVIAFMREHADALGLRGTDG
jgi:hypothetical protein